MVETKGTFVSGVNKQMPTPSVSDAYPERIMRLTFDIQANAALVPTVVTRATGADGDSALVPSQVFLMAPMASISRLSPSHTTAPPVEHPSAVKRQEGRRWAAVTAPGPHVDVAGVSLPGYAPGYKDRNQDSALLLDIFLSNRQQLLAVFDGHGPEGHRVSTFAKRNLPYTLLRQLVEEGEARTGGAAGAAGASRISLDGAAPQTASTSAVAAVSPSAWVSSAPAPAAPIAATGCGGGPVPRAMWRAITSLDWQLEHSGIDVVNSGSTAALCHVNGRRVTAAWVGDSRMLLGLPARGGGASPAAGEQRSAAGSGNGNAAAAATGVFGAASSATAKEVEVVAKQEADRGGGGGGGCNSVWRVAWISHDHKPEFPEEAQRIQAAGGRVARSVGQQGPVGPYRVWFQHQAYPGLAMSRALGDLPGRRIGITCTPSCAFLRLPDSGPAVLVLASDGVWELLSNEQVLELAAGAGSAAEAASRVVQQSRRAWVKEYGGSYVDDITALVMRIDMPPQTKQRLP